MYLIYDIPVQRPTANPLCTCYEANYWCAILKTNYGAGSYVCIIILRYDTIYIWVAYKDKNCSHL